MTGPKKTPAILTISLPQCISKRQTIDAYSNLLSKEFLS
jgi:hypothetical protein